MKPYIFILSCLMAFAVSSVQCQPIYVENFENVANNALPAGWYSSATQPGSWRTGVNTDFALSTYNIPPAHTKFIGLKLDTSWEHIARYDTLILPLIPLQNTTIYNNATLYMDLYYVPFQNDYCSCDISFDAGASWINIYYQLPTKFWEPFFITLPQLVNRSSIMFRFVHKAVPDADMNGLFMDNFRFYDQAGVDAAIYDVLPHNDTIRNYAGLAQGDTIKASVVNMTSNAIPDLVLKYKLGNGPVYADTFTAISLQGYASTTLAHHIPCTVPAVSNYPLKAWVEAIGDADHTNDTGATTILGAAFLPDKKPLIEERGGTWCGWCVRGLFYNDSLWRAHAFETSIISVHNSHGAPDPMTIPAYDSFLNNIEIKGETPSVFGYPSIIAERNAIADPVSTFYEYDNYKQYFGYGSLDINGVSRSGNDLSLNINFMPAINMNGNYRLGLVITEDSVHNANGGMPWSQSNSYSYMLQNIPFYGYEGLPSPIPAAQMYYDFVARTNLNEPNGVPGSLPLQMTYNNIYSHTFHVTLDTSWKFEHLRAVAILFRSGDSVVLNTNNRDLADALSINTPAAANTMEVFPNPAHEMLYAQCACQPGGNVALLLTDVLGRTVYEHNYMAARGQVFSVPVKGLTPGTYNLQLKTKQGIWNKRVSVTAQ